MNPRPSPNLHFLVSLPLIALLTGCSMTQMSAPSTQASLSIKGNVHGGQQPVVGAHVYLFAANTTGYGQPSVSLLNATTTGNGDTLGGYVLTAADGSFNITGDYTCPPNTQAYAYAVGGNPGAGSNSAAGFLAVVGNCPNSGSFASSTPYLYLNEISTVAAAYAMSGYATDATHVASSGSALAQTGIANAFLNSANLATLATGNSLAITAAGNGIVPQSLINTVANILASCINSTGPGSTACTTLLGTAKSGGTTGTTPSDTATAAINIAHNPAASVATLYALAAANPPFAPALTSAPNDFLVGIRYGGASPHGSGLNGAYSIAIDAQGNVWFTNPNDGSISKLSSSGTPLSPNTGFLTGLQSLPLGIAIDTAGNAWVVDAVHNNLTEYNTAGIAISPVGGYTGGGIQTPQGLSIDSNNNIWIANYPNNSVSEFNSSGMAQSPSTGFTGGGLSAPSGIAVDAANGVWVTNNNPAPGSLSKLSSSGAPVSGSAGYLGGGLSNPQGVAIDAGNRVWVTNHNNNSVSQFTATGVALSSTGFTGGGLNAPYFLGIDGGGNVWVANSGNNSVTELTSTGTAISPSTGYGSGLFISPEAIEVDGAGSVWVTNYNSTSTTNNVVTQLIGAAIPRITPLSVALKNGKLGTRP